MANIETDKRQQVVINDLKKRVGLLRLALTMITDSGHDDAKMLKRLAANELKDDNVRQSVAEEYEASIRPCPTCNGRKEVLIFVRHSEQPDEKDTDLAWCKDCCPEY